jgi:hypothetical protein
MLRQIIFRADEVRFARAVAGLIDGYTVDIVRRADAGVVIATIRLGDRMYTCGVARDGDYSCTCPDYEKRNGATPCKHVLMLVLHIIARRARKGAAAKNERRDS